MSNIWVKLDLGEGKHATPKNVAKAGNDNKGDDVEDNSVLG